MNKFTSLLAGVSLLAIAGGVNAEPVVLSDDQMDGISAGDIGTTPPPPTIPLAYGPGGNKDHGNKVGNAVNRPGFLGGRWL